MRKKRHKTALRGRGHVNVQFSMMNLYPSGRHREGQGEAIVYQVALTHDVVGKVPCYYCIYFLQSGSLSCPIHQKVTLYTRAALVVNGVIIIGAVPIPD